MVLDGGVFTSGAITSTFTAVLRISQVVYELKAVGEQTRDLLNTTKYVNSSLEAVRELRRKKSDILNREEKKWMDQQIDFTQKAVDSVAVLIERARVDMQAKNETGNEDDYKTKHIKIHHRARFVLQDSPKVLTNLGLVTMAMNGLNSVMVTLSSREGRDVRSPQSRETFQRRKLPGAKAPPPAYAEAELTLNKSVQEKQVSQNLAFLAPDDPASPPFFGTQTVSRQPLHSRASVSSITPSVNFSDAYYENAIADDTISPPACLPTAFIRDSISSDEYFGPYEMETTISTPSYAYEMENTTSMPSDTYEMEASIPRNLLQTWHSAPAVPTIPRKPVGCQRHRANNLSVPSINEETDKYLANPRPSSAAPHQISLDAQKQLPILPLNLAPAPSLHPTPSVSSLSSTFSAPSSSGSTNIGAPPISRGRSWLMDRAEQAAAGKVSPASRTQSHSSTLQNPYAYHSPDDFRNMPGGRAELG